MKVATSKNFSEVLSENEIAVVKFGAVWCGPCKMIEPVLESVAEQKPEITIAKLDVDNDGDVASQYEVMSLPTTIFFKNGEVVKQQVGFIAEGQLVEIIESL